MTQTNRTYPRDVWVLMPSFKPVKVTVVARYSSYSREDYGDKTAEGKNYAVADMHPSLEAAITQGWKDVERIQADLMKRKINLDKKIEALRKATPVTSKE